ncbi:hypothetical protein C0J52_07357 [Blattella germanica]|nr:hypothetical protein C0J52_07357 [Blattella germanica]
MIINSRVYKKKKPPGRWGSEKTTAKASNISENSVSVSNEYLKFLKMASDKQKINVELKKEDLETLLRQQIGSDLKVESFTSKSLTKPGDNYGSTMLAVEVDYKINGKNIIKLPIVAKLVPESPFLRKVFNIENTFRKEVRAYTLVGPAYDKLQKEKGLPENEILDIFPRYYGARSNKENDDNIDADETAVLLLENLKITGYDCPDRRKGFNLKHMEMAITSLAKFHALSLALKMLKPKVFEDTVLKACAKFKLGLSDDDVENEKWVNGIMDLVKAIPYCEPYLERIEKSLRADISARNIERKPREPFATIVHNDFWVNNMMFKYRNSAAKGDETPLAMKFVDFQVTLYDSPVRDLIFLLFTSSEDGLLDKHYDRFIRLYHNRLIDTLQKLGCDTEAYSFEHFQGELNIYCPKEFPHILFMVNPISADPEGMQETSTLDENSITHISGGDVYVKKVMPSETQKLDVELKKEDLETLLRQQIGSDLNVTSFTSKPLTQPGDNYGSTMLSVEVSYQTNGNNEIIKLPIVAKLVPESPFLRKVFDIENTFRKEVRAYTLVGPVYSQIQKEKGISETEILNIFPKYFGSRCNKENDDNIDADETAVLLLENLKISGYETPDRRKGFNLKHMEMAVSSLAKFHALSIVLKILKPKVFEDTILKACAKYRLGKIQNDEEDEKWISGIMNLLKSIPSVEPYLERIEISARADFKAKKEGSKPREPFATIVHNDFWVNNMMFKYQNSINKGDELKKYEVPIAMKFVDFQVTIYDSPVRDLIFLLFSSSEDGLLAKHYNHFIHLYHEHFINILKRFGCNTEPYSFKHFQEELNVFSPKEFPHILFMLNVISANPEGMQETSSIDEDSILVNRGGNIFENKSKKMSSEIQKLNVELKKEDLETLLCQQIGSDLTVTSFTSKPLTQPGDNYGSTMLAVEVSYQTNGNNEIIKLPIVAKLVPESPFLRKVFDIENTFRKEVIAYTLVSPVYSQLQKEKGISEIEILDIFPKYYGSRKVERGPAFRLLMMTSEIEKLSVELKKKDLETLLCQQIGLDLKVTSFTSKPLTQPGDNYGSTMLAVEVSYQTNGSNEIIKLPIVAKLVPESPFLRKLFDIENTFWKEVRIYTLVSPAYNKLQKEKGISENEILDIFPKYYGSRCNKENDDNIDADETAVLLLENLKISGYETPDRRKGFNLKHMEMAVSSLAKFHALSIALKLLKPKVFEDTILKACAKYTLGKTDDDEEDERWTSGIMKILKSIPDCEPYLERIEKSVRADFQAKKEGYKPREPFATIVHNDFWRLGCNTEHFSFKHFQEELNIICPKEFPHILFMLNPVTANPEGMQETSSVGEDSLPVIVNKGGHIFETKALYLIKTFDSNGWL